MFYHLIFSVIFIGYNLLKNKNYIHASFEFPTKPKNELYRVKNIFQNKSSGLVIGGGNLD